MVLRGHFSKPASKTITLSIRTSLIAILVALSVISNYALIWMPNVKLMDLFVFVGGFISGPYDGAVIGALSWMVYGLLNPHGWILTILVATIFGEMVYGIAGGIIGKIRSQAGRIELSFLALVCTIFYDFVTNVAFALTFKIPIKMTLLTGIPFSLIHEFSNVVLFFLVGPELIKFIDRVFLSRFEP